MSELDHKIIEILKNHPQGLKAREIADLLGADRKTINSRLYSNDYKKTCVCDSKYVWRYIKKDAKTNSLIVSEEQDKINTDHDLVNLCNYYLECLALENSEGVSVYQISKFSLDYAEIGAIEDYKSNQSVQNLISKVSRSNKSFSTYLGYPVLIRELTSKTGNRFRMVSPVLLFNIDTKGGTVETSRFPIINIDAIKNYSANNAQEAFSELLNLSNELGLNNPDQDFDLNEIALKLQSIREWEWKEDLDPDELDTDVSVKDTNVPGVYNKAVVVAVERKPFTLGLENELAALKEIDQNSYKESALYSWLHPEQITHNMVSNNDNDELLEVLPLNVEQENAIHVAMHNNIAVITGPPGTGKSQVVTDFLVNAAYHDKSVLFASHNNKAVDVVYDRVNGLAKKPVMIRIGSNQYAHTMADIIESLLSCSASLTDHQEYEHYREVYQERLKKYRDIKSRKNDVLALRNQTDHASQRMEEYRNQWDHMINTVDSTFCDSFNNSVSEYKTAKQAADKSMQPLFTRLFWFTVKEERKIEYEKKKKKLNDLLSSYGQKLISDTDDEEDYLDDCEKALETLAEYRQARNELDNTMPFEILDKQLLEAKEELSDVATLLWQKYLESKPLDITAQQRQEMSDYVTASHLFDGDDNLQEDTDLNKQYRKLSRQMSKYLPCWAVTSLSVRGRVAFHPATFDYIVIDEASQCDIASAIPLLYRAKNAVIIGDPNQLNNISTISNKQDVQLMSKYKIGLNWSYTEKSLYDHASTIVASNEIISLRDHHRSYADIIEFSNQEFYNNALRVATDYSQLNYPKNSKPGITWVNVKGNTLRPKSGSAINEKEAEKVLMILQRFATNTEFKGTIGVVTPFRAQADLISERLRKNDALYQQLLGNNLVIDTAHKFQGDEKDIMIFSSVITESAPQSTIGFLSVQGNIFNVAITRAKAMLIVVGDQEYCAKCEVKYMKDFANYVTKLNAKKANETAQVIIPDNHDYPYVNNPEEVSDWERLFYSALYDAGILTFPQYPVDKYKLDLALKTKTRMLDIEIDGQKYHADWNGELLYRDQLRNQRLIEMGWDVKRFWVYQIRDELSSCINQIKTWLGEERESVNPPAMKAVSNEKIKEVSKESEKEVNISSVNHSFRKETQYLKTKPKKEENNDSKLSVFEANLIDEIESRKHRAHMDRSLYVDISAYDLMDEFDIKSNQLKRVLLIMKKCSNSSRDKIYNNDTIRYYLE